MSELHLNAQYLFFGSIKRLNVILLMNRLVNMSDNRISKIVFDADYHNLSPHSWSSEIKYIMTELQLLNNFNNKSAVDLNCAKLNAYSIHSESWIQTVQSSPKLRTYKLFKNTFETENYLKLNLTKHERSMLSQFRCGILPLRIETGRYVNEPLYERICSQCDLKCIESEQHILLECSFYDSIRLSIFGDALQSDVFTSKTDNDKLKYFLLDATRKTAKYLVNAIQARRRKLYA